MSESQSPSEQRSGKLMRIFLDEGDRLGGKPLYIAIVDALRAAGFTGATVLKGIEGFGVHRAVNAARSFDFSANLPVVIEIVESEERINEFLPTLRSMIEEGLITLENVMLIRLSKGSGS